MTSSLFILVFWHVLRLKMALYRLGCNLVRLSAQVLKIGLKRAFVGAVGCVKVSAWFTFYSRYFILLKGVSDAHRHSFKFSIESNPTNLHTTKTISIFFLHTTGYQKPQNTFYFQRFSVSGLSPYSLKNKSSKLLENQHIPQISSTNQLIVWHIVKSLKNQAIQGGGVCFCFYNNHHPTISTPT